jgi:chromosomal replication initiation ATPase DnaA
MVKTKVRAGAARPESAPDCALEPVLEPLAPQNDAERALFVMELVSMATGVPAAHMACDTRNYARAARARMIAMYLVYVSWRWPLARVGRAFGRDRTTAGHACRMIEDLRDDDAFDAELEHLEACLQNAPLPRAIKLLHTNLLEMTG